MVFGDLFGGGGGTNFDFPPETGAILNLILENVLADSIPAAGDILTGALTGKFPVTTGMSPVQTATAQNAILPLAEQDILSRLSLPALMPSLSAVNVPKNLGAKGKAGASTQGATGGNPAQNNAALAQMAASILGGNAGNFSTSGGSATNNSGSIFGNLGGTFGGTGTKPPPPKAPTTSIPQQPVSDFLKQSLPLPDIEGGELTSILDELVGSFLAAVDPKVANTAFDAIPGTPFAQLLGSNKAFADQVKKELEKRIVRLHTQTVANPNNSERKAEERVNQRLLNFLFPEVERAGRDSEEEGTSGSFATGFEGIADEEDDDSATTSI